MAKEFFYDADYKGRVTSNLIETRNVIAKDITITASCNAMSVGPVEIADNCTVTIPATSTWVIL